MNKILCQTTVEIRGFCIPTIPKGTQFTMTRRGQYWSSCEGLPINTIWNDEYETVMGNDFSI